MSNWKRVLWLAIGVVIGVAVMAGWFCYEMLSDFCNFG